MDRIWTDPVASLAARQHGVVSLTQLSELVPSRSRRRRLVDTGHLERLLPTVFAVPGSPATRERALRAGLLWLGPEAMVSHRAAAALHGFERSDPGAVEFQVPRRVRGRQGAFIVHSTAHLGPLDVVDVDGFPVTSATRTVIDLARARVPDVVLEAAIDSAVHSWKSSPAALAERLAELRGRGRWGAPRLDRLLVDAGGHTVLERRFLTLVRSAGLPRPCTQVIHRDGDRRIGRVDFEFVPYGLVVEVSGRRGHASDAERTRDAQRRNELQALGRTVIEYTWHHVTNEPTYVRRSLEAHLRRAGWDATSPAR